MTRSGSAGDIGLAHHHHHHHHHHSEPDGTDGGGVGSRRWFLRNLRYILAVIVLAGIAGAACMVTVPPGSSIVVTRFGDPVRVLVEPGLAWKLPPPIDDTVNVDLRLRTTSSGLHDVGTRDGLRILVQAYVAWQVPDDPEHVKQFLRAVRNQPDAAASQLRSFIGSLLEITASGFDLANLVNTDPSKIKLAEFEEQLRQRIDQQALSVYGVAVRQVGIERLTLPYETLLATVERMAAERNTVAAERSAEGQRAAAQIASDADRDSRVMLASAKSEASAIESESRVEAAEIYREAFTANPELYNLLRSFDTLESVVGNYTRLILRTDSAPFRALVEGPQSGDDSGAGTFQGE